jgi:very-short-patch-repair endonuclease
MSTRPATAPRTLPFTVTAEGAPGLSYEELRTRAFVLTSRGVRLPALSATSLRGRLLAAQVPLRPESVLSHTTAAQLLGLPLPLALQADERAHVTTPRHLPRPRRRDIVTHHAQLHADHVQEFRGLRLTTASRTYVDMASLLGFDSLVALGDVVLRQHHITHEALMAVALWRVRYPGRGRAVAAIGWLDAGAESPQESRLRVLLRRARLPRPEVNGVITDAAGRPIARGDLVFRRYRVIVEYDGEVHAPMAQRARDADRRARLRENGWIVVEVVGADMHHPERVVSRVRSALRDGRARLS